MPFWALDSLEQPHTQLKEPSNHRHYPMVFISVHQTHISQSCQKHHFQPHQVVQMSCICQCHQRCNHPTNHRHYPMFSKFGCLKKYSFKHKSLSFGQNTLSNHSKLYQCLAFVSVTIDATTPTIICTTLWISSLEVWRNISCFDKFTAFSSLVGFRRQHTQHTHICT